MDNNQFQPVQPPLEPVSTTEPMLTPEPEPSTPSAPTRKSRKGPKLVAIILLVLLAIAGVGYSAYAMMQNSSQQASLNDKDSEIKVLNSKIASLSKTDESTSVTNTTTSSGNVIAIRELGVSITVPDSIKDVTYSYKSSTYGVEAQFSTKKLTDTYKATGECTSFDTAPPLGLIERREGQAGSGATASTTVIKQFTGFYILYSSPQAVCAKTQTTVPAELQIFKDSLSTLKEL